MKNVEIKSFHLCYEDACKYIREIFGEDAVIEFDDKCMTNMKILFLNGEIANVTAEYNKISAKTKDGKTLYWPIQPKTAQHTIEFAKATFKDKLA